MASAHRKSLGNFKTIKLNNLDYFLSSLGFKLASNGAYYYKNYNLKNASLNIGVICDDKNIYDILSFLKSDNNILSNIKKAEKIYDSNIQALDSLSMNKIAYQFGLEGGSSGLHNINLDESLGGPRWWSYDSDEEDLSELESFLQKQTRYNPSYLSAGRPLQIGEDTYTALTSINDDIKSARLIKDRQEALIEYIDGNNKVQRIKVPSLKQTMESGKYDGDLSQDIDKYQLKIVKVDGESLILIRKKDTRGDIRGIWEINQNEATPGFAYIGEDWRTSYSLHPEFLDDPDWVNGMHSPGRNNYTGGNPR
jgi:hypothetical protein